MWEHESIKRVGVVTGSDERGEATPKFYLLEDNWLMLSPAGIIILEAAKGGKNESENGGW